MSLNRQIDIGEVVAKNLPAIGEFCKKIYAGFVEDIRSPDEFSVEFGVQFGGKTGIIITEANIQANLKISAKWTKPSKSLGLGS